MTGDDGRRQVLAALEGQAPERVPVGVLTWGFDYLWKTAGLRPWQLACGGIETWHRAYLALLERHDTDVIWVTGHGSGPEEPTLLDEDTDRWMLRDGNTGAEYRLLKGSLALVDARSSRKGCDPVGEIHSEADADRLLPRFTTHGERHLACLRRLIAEVGDRALVLPCHSPAYICACYSLGFERAMEAMLREPGLFHYVCGRFASGDRARMAELAAVGAEAVYIADSWASCDIISRSQFERFALPYQASVAKAAREAGLRVILWNLGDVLPILDLEAGLQIDAFHPEQPRKMAAVTLDKVRAVFGPKRCLFGNLDSEGLLLRARGDEIADEVRAQLRGAGPGAPFVLTTGSPIPSDAEPEAVDMIIRAARQAGTPD